MTDAPSRPTENFGLFADRRLGVGYVDKGRFDNNHGDAKPHARLAGHIKRCGEWAAAADVADRIARHRDLIAAQPGGKKLDLHATARCVTGIGETSPLMVGFHVDWTSGWPMVPGSGLKGMTRAWVEHWAAPSDLACHGVDESILDEIFLAIFGWPAEDDDPGSAGDVVFFDGWWCEESRIALDVMTPHHAAFLLSDGYDATNPKDRPADWNDPTPIPFLVVEQGAKLITGLAARRPVAAPLVPIAEYWLRGAAKSIGLGAKTSEGRGRFS